MLIVANWKAYVTDAKRARGLYSLGKRLAKTPRVSIVLAPPAPYLGLLAAKKSRVGFAAQDISGTTGGAATGEVSAGAAFAAGARYAIVGHSERRAMGESEEAIAQKMRHAVATGLTPILCVGESNRDSEGRYLTNVRAQIVAGTKLLSSRERAGIIVAYEPVWAIGKAAADAISPSDLGEMSLYIRKVMAELLPGKGKGGRVLYGGSVEPGNIRALAAGSLVDGFLIGHASVDPALFKALVLALK